MDSAQLAHCACAGGANGVYCEATRAQSAVLLTATIPPSTVASQPTPGLLLISRLPCSFTGTMLLLSLVKLRCKQNFSASKNDQLVKRCQMPCQDGTEVLCFKPREHLGSPWWVWVTLTALSQGSQPVEAS